MLSQSPSSSLPPIGRLASHSTTDIVSAISLLRRIYSPPVRGSAPLLRIPVSISPRPSIKLEPPPTDSGYASAVVSDEESEDEDEEADNADSQLEVLRADAFERSFALRWLTSFIARSAEWSESGDTDSENQQRQDAVNSAAALLAACAGTSACGALSRSFTFGRRKSAQVNIELNDAPLSSQDHTSVGLQTWGSSCVLAEILAQSPANFGLINRPRKTRVLELGAGTGLVSLVIGKIAQTRHLPTDVVASDFHPSVLANLQTNVATNFPRIPAHLALEAQHLDWETPQLEDPPFNQPFDLVIGSDVIYEPEHCAWIRRCVEQLLRRPEPGELGPPPSLHLISPLRPTHTVEIETIEKEFPWEEKICKSRAPGNPLQLAIIRVEEIEKLAGVGRADEVRYRWWTISWV